MEYFSTRDESRKVTASQAIAGGLAPDGGLYVPSELPKLSLDEIRELCAMDYRGRAARIIAKYMPEYSAEEISAFVTAAYGDNFDDPAVAPLRFTDPDTAFLELWHGPTCAFKDMALQILPHFLTASLKKCGEERQVCILVATSGDTGKAALEGFADVPGTKILVFFPNDGVSDVQKLQMVTQSGKNVMVSAVYGNFDDAQTGVKKIFGDREFADELSKRGYFLSSANSINWGRLLPQIVYYVSAYCDYVNSKNIALGDAIDFAVPTGNFGDILAGWYAKKMGLPAGRLICCSNSNNVLTDFLHTGTYDRNRKFYTTISPSMDILVSSNLERLLYALCGSDAQVSGYMKELSQTGKYSVDNSIKAALAADFAAGFCSDRETKAAIGRMYKDRGYLMDTHTAVAYSVLDEYRSLMIRKTPTVVVSTASPFKFCDSVLSALGHGSDAPGTELIGELARVTGLAAPSPLAGLAQRQVRFTGCAQKDALKQVVDEFLK
jgi:threonine synthase